MKKIAFLLCSAISLNFSVAFASEPAKPKLLFNKQQLQSHVEAGKTAARQVGVSTVSTASADDDVCVATNIGITSQFKGGSQVILMAPSGCGGIYFNGNWKEVNDYQTTPIGLRIFLAVSGDGVIRTPTWNTPRLDSEVVTYSQRPVSFKTTKDIFMIYPREAVMYVANVAAVGAFMSKESSVCDQNGCFSSSITAGDDFAILDRELPAYRGSPIYDERKSLVGLMYGSGNNTTIVMTYFTILDQLQKIGIVPDGSGKGIAPPISTMEKQ